MIPTLVPTTGQVTLIVSLFSCVFARLMLVVCGPDSAGFTWPGHGPLCVPVRLPGLLLGRAEFSGGSPLLSGPARTMCEAGPRRASSHTAHGPPPPRPGLPAAPQTGSVRRARGSWPLKGPALSSDPFGWACPGLRAFPPVGP